MEDVRIIIAVLWVVLMLVYLLGDVMRIFAGDFTAGKIEGVEMTQSMLMLMALIMLVPIVMAFLSLVLPYPIIRWMNIIIPIVLLGFNLVGLPSYPGFYDRFLIVVGLVFNMITVWYAWMWI